MRCKNEVYTITRTQKRTLNEHYKNEKLKTTRLGSINLYIERTSRVVTLTSDLMTF